ncbi:hypothetical protein Cni_G11773 [Canna indica]|uniref:Uncharacterized protein n=1 Tax=Canna indica TaxID=4628 RepID=A0AAQ3K9G2_9LILI|nr:hypothetical protein Cni_G11773 [Canna indica]
MMMGKPGCDLGLGRESFEDSPLVLGPDLVVSQLFDELGAGDHLVARPSRSRPSPPLRPSTAERFSIRSDSSD